jgi:hypothetical protein
MEEINEYKIYLVPVIEWMRTKLSTVMIKTSYTLGSENILFRFFNVIKDDYFITFLTIYNIFFLTYIFILGFYNRLAWDDYIFLAHMKKYGFLGGIPPWYMTWQGRFCPHLFINMVLVIYSYIPNMIVYPILISTLFIVSIFKILKNYFELNYYYLINYSVLLFSGLILTSLQFNTFFWPSASAMYFGGVLFCLIGIASVVNNKSTNYSYIFIPFSFLFLGCSSEPVGFLACLVLGGTVLFILYNSKFDVKQFFRNSINVKLFIALLFCSIGFLIMMLSPGNKARMSNYEQLTDVFSILKITFYSTVYLFGHAFFKLPYFICLMLPFLLLGVKLQKNILLKRFSVYKIVLCFVILFLAVFIANAPVVYATGTHGPLRSYVYFSFIILTAFFLFFLYLGYHYFDNEKILKFRAMLSILFLFALVFYSFSKELPLVKKYNQSDKDRVALLMDLKKKHHSGVVVVAPLYSTEYTTITDLFRKVTHTYREEMSDTPLLISEIGEKEEWSNDAISKGLDLGFPIIMSKTKK